MNQQVIDERKVQNAVQALRILLVALVAAGAAGLIWTLMQNRAQDRSEKAFTLLFQADRLERVAAQEAETLKSDPVQVMNGWSADKKQDYQTKLNAVLKDYPKTAAGAVAGLRLGRFYFNAGDFAKAREQFRGVVDHSTSHEMLLYKAMAIESLASVSEAEKNFEEARKTFDEAISLKDNPLKPLAYLGKARSLRSLGKADEAKTTYEKLMQEFPDTVYARKARVLLSGGEG